MEELKQRLYLTFVLQDRWKFFLDGLGMTLLLTAASFILGSLLGALFCALKLSKFKRLNKIAGAIISMLVQLPTLVLLMLFVYILFGETSLSATLVVIFGLTLKAGAYISEIFCSAVTTVNPGEIEAATPSACPACGSSATSSCPRPYPRPFPSTRISSSLPSRKPPSSVTWPSWT